MIEYFRLFVERGKLRVVSFDMGFDMAEFNNDLKIRTAVAGNEPLVLALICELAEYEKLLHEVVATESMLHDALFGEDRTARAIIAEWQGEPVGFALYFYNFSTFLGRKGIYLEDLYVRPAMRGKGIGKALLKSLARIALEKNCGRLEWAVLDWNEPAIQFYKSLGARQLNEWIVNRVTGDELQKLAE